MCHLQLGPKKLEWVGQDEETGLLVDDWGTGVVLK